MYASTFLAALLGASAVTAAPAWPQIKWDVSDAMGGNAVSEYFNLLADAVQYSRTTPAPVCNLANAIIPTLTQSPLPLPAAGLVLKHVAVGRGTQNYTCDLSNSTAVPAAAGAVAALFNASCVASTYPDLLHSVPKLSLQFDLPASELVNATADALNNILGNVRLGPTNLQVSGKHYFTDLTTPFFDLDTQHQRVGKAPCSKANATAAPADAPKGRAGEAAVPWLRLTAHADATGGIKEVFRVKTAGGSAPAKCQGQPASFQVQYAAE
ncbi:hypothetical protein F5Y17DRAFT_138031 [Xylariaceae sp. FL0594]|nr:hypothetical protein F5Y17DRAFT_138031 [Xylariaceae sp. FL0594]